MDQKVLAIDVGTQSVRAAVATPQGEIQGIAQILQDVRTLHPGWADQQPDHWWKLVCDVIRQIVSQTASSPSSIAAVSVCGQMHAPVGIDKSGAVTTPWVQLWCDKRSVEQCEEVRRNFEERQLSAVTANPINPAWTGLKVLWVKKHQPEDYQKTDYFLTPKDFINFKLAGVAATDHSEASGTFLYDAVREDYSPKLADQLGLNLRKFAPIADSYQQIGAVTEQAAGETGLLPDTPVVAGGGDFPVSLLGLGIVTEGVCSDITGSSNLISLYTTKPLIHPAVQNLKSVAGGWIPFTILDSGGFSMKWCKEFAESMNRAEVSYDELLELAMKIPAGSEGLIFYPYLLGERRWDNARARGAYAGIAPNHKAGHFIRATMEGVALAMAMNIKIFEGLGVRVDSVSCAGGGIRNKLWNQIKADVLERPIVLSEEPEAGLRGGALLASAGAGLIADLVSAAGGRSQTTPVVPNPETAERYRASFTEFKRFYDHFLGYWS